MMKARFPAAVLVALFLAATAQSQDYAPPPSIPPEAKTKALIEQRTLELGKAILALQRLGVRDPILADVEIYHKAAAWINRLDEYYDKRSPEWTLKVLDLGLLRASQAGRGEAPWLLPISQMSLKAYRSRVDGSLQPYAVTYPKDFGKDPKTKWRVDLVLHGRDNSLNEVKFIQQHSAEKAVPPDQKFIQIDIFGRGNNAYRWAGETDVEEVWAAFVNTERMLGRADAIDPRRVVLRGFSMGGAGTWHFGLHRPDNWCVIGPGAGFTTTVGYVKDLPTKLPSHIEACLHIYDAVDYAPNAFNVPIVAYGGSDDPQLQAARNIEAILKPLNIPMTLLVAEGLKHEFPPVWRANAEAEYEKYAAPGKGRKEYPQQVRFTTFTLKFSRCDWVDILGLDRHYVRAEVDATRTETGFTVKTKNVRTLKLRLPEGDINPQVVQIDGQELSAQASMLEGSRSIYFKKQDGRWSNVMPQVIQTDQARRLQKTRGLQGPIDDAFMDGFLCVRGTLPNPWNPEMKQYADATLDRFVKEWEKFFRGELDVKNDTEVTDEDIASKHLILFGDPSSNSLIAQVAPRLPLQWSKDRLVFGEKTYETSTHLPVMIYPSPLNPSRYVVLNSGHTFHADSLMKTNALLFPRLGDYAIIKPAPGKDDPLVFEIADVGIYDDFWNVPSQKGLNRR
jgi:pimeloyl-ACP methyl ester carboxylesterase